MIIVKPLGLNAALVMDEDGREAVVLGCGVGFGARNGDHVDEHRVERTFVAAATDRTRRVPNPVGAGVTTIASRA